jgi:two-component system sensor kinase FixL
MFSVEDSGPGIDGQLRDQLFRPLTSTKTTGMGLGLAICRSLIEANEGRIWLVRSDSGGTCIAFTVPLATQDVNEVDA